jgi:phytoene/squalene synthetase
VTVDLLKDRVYIPLDVMERHGYTVEDLCARRFTPAFREVMREAWRKRASCFWKGCRSPAWWTGGWRSIWTCSAAAAMRVLEKIERRDYDVLAARPAISKAERVRLLLGRWRAWPSRGRPHERVEQSYEYCRRVARTRAKNFYYSFLLLTAQQRKAMCAIYAFMRYCDDLSDEPGATRAALERWRAELEEALEGRFSGHPVWPAFHHTVRRFGIPHDYFRAMIDGVVSDLEPRRFETFDQLYRYCYQVASVVGLTTIHIFGFDTPTALPLAEKCGVAFQLTNILRDIREDAGSRPHLSARRRSAALRRDRRGLARGQAQRGVSGADAARSRARARLLRGIAAAAGPDSPAQPAVAVGADFHLLAAARAHREQRLRRVLAPRAALGSGEVLDRGGST